MIAYCDTSALLKRYVKEAGSTQVHEILAAAEYVLTSTFTELELTSAVERLKREHVIDSSTYRNAHTAIEKDFRQKIFVLLDIESDTIHQAKRVVRQRRLRAPDALQLASALTTAKEFSPEVVFLCANGALLEAARVEGLHTRDVSK